MSAKNEQDKKVPFFRTRCAILGLPSSSCARAGATSDAAFAAVMTLTATVMASRRAAGPLLRTE